MNQHKHLTTPTSSVQCLQVVLQPLSDAQPVLVSHLPGLCAGPCNLSSCLCPSWSAALSSPLFSSRFRLPLWPHLLPFVSVIQNEEPQLKLLDRAAGVRLADVCKMSASLCFIKSICYPLASIVRIPQEVELRLLHIS